MNNLRVWMRRALHRTVRGEKQTNAQVLKSMRFASEFSALLSLIDRCDNFLLAAHSRPDADTTGSVLAFKEYLESRGKQADIVCTDPFPAHLESFTGIRFLSPENVDFSHYQCFIAADSVERGFERIAALLPADAAIVIVDHHPNIALRGTVTIIDETYSSVCEIIYDFFAFTRFQITRSIATFLLLGILGDTGNFQHANTNARVMAIASDLLKHGAPLSRIIEVAFANKKISTLRLWGKAFEKSKINSNNGMIATVLTEHDIKECQATADDIAQVSSILNTVPGTRFALVLSERGNGVIKGSLRSEEYKNVDVSAIAQLLGGGGHKLASGFEIKGRIIETSDGWEVV